MISRTTFAFVLLSACGGVHSTSALPEVSGPKVDCSTPQCAMFSTLTAPPEGRIIFGFEPTLGDIAPVTRAPLTSDQFDPIYLGGSVHVDYDARRLVAGDRIKQLDVRLGASQLFPLTKSNPVSWQGVVRLPQAPTVRVSIEATLEDGTVACDPPGTEGYPLVPHEWKAALAQFNGDFGETVAGTPARGGVLVVDYDPNRLQTCARRSYGEDLYVIEANLLFDEGTRQAEHVLDIDGRKPADFHIPANAQSAQIWFRSTNQEGCVAWDSNYGSNYLVQIH